MPRRKHTEDMELEFLKWKNKKLQRDLDRKRSRKHKKKKRSRSRSNHTHRSRSRDRDRSRSPPRKKDRSGTPVRFDNHSRSHSKESICENTANNAIEHLELNNSNEETIVQATVTESTITEPTNVTDMSTTSEIELVEETMPNDLDTNLLEILGADPSTTVHYGKDIHPELASRLQHIATTGLTKESRKELTDKYLIPANSLKIGAPAINAEIKAAVTENVVKRDRGIEGRQKQLAAAISGLANVLHNELDSKDKDSNRSKQLMDICRILCDIQHAESNIRRNFAIFSIKKELKEHLVNTKIDKTLFGEDLAETLKSAKAVTKSGTELKTRPPPKTKMPASSGNLNWKSPAPVRKQPQQGAPRGREAALQPAPGPTQRYTRNMPLAGLSKTSYHQPKQNRRR